MFFAQTETRVRQDSFLPPYPTSLLSSVATFYLRLLSAENSLGSIYFRLAPVASDCLDSLSRQAALPRCAGKANNEAVHTKDIRYGYHPQNKQPR